MNLLKTFYHFHGFLYASLANGNLVQSFVDLSHSEENLLVVEKKKLICVSSNKEKIGLAD